MSNLCISLGRNDTLTTLGSPTHESLHLLRSPFLFFLISILQFSAFKSCTQFFRFTPKYVTFSLIIIGTVFLISASRCSELVYRNAIDFSRFIVGTAHRKALIVHIWNVPRSKWVRAVTGRLHTQHSKNLGTLNLDIRSEWRGLWLYVKSCAEVLLWQIRGSYWGGEQCNSLRLLSSSLP